MILDEVLQEEDTTFDTDSMVDMFVEGFLYALEMQENGQKANSMEELSETLSEAANTAISELSKDLLNRAAEKSSLLKNYHEKKFADTTNDGIYLDRNKSTRHSKEVQELNKNRILHAKRWAKYNRINDKINQRLNKK